MVCLDAGCLDPVCLGLGAVCLDPVSGSDLSTACLDAGCLDSICVDAVWTLFLVLVSSHADFSAVLSGSDRSDLVYLNHVCLDPVRLNPVCRSAGCCLMAASFGSCDFVVIV